MCKINGKKLAEVRTNAGISQENLAKKVGVARSTINNYERGKANPSDSTVDKICFILKIDKENIEIHDVGYDFLSGSSKTIDKVRSRKGFVRYSTPTETEKWINERRKVSSEEETKEVNTALKNSFGIGSKRYILIDPTVIHVPDWQRDTDMAKATEIAENFNEDKFDPIKAYVSPELKLIGADGVHRVVAFIINGETKILVEVLNCNEHEAVLTFLGQQSGRKTMTVSDTYRAGIKANIEEYVNFKNLFESYNIQITTEEKKIDNPIGKITPSGAALRMVENDKETLIRSIKLIAKLEWCGSTSKNAFVMRNFQVLKRLYSTFGEDADKKLIKYCKGAAFYESKVFPIKSNAELFDMLSAEISK